MIRSFRLSCVPWCRRGDFATALSTISIAASTKQPLKSHRALAPMCLRTEIAAPGAVDALFDNGRRGRVPSRC